MKRSTSANATISSNLRSISRRRMPRIAPFRKMFSRPVRSPWKPVPTSSSEPTRPRMTASPSVGSVMRERIFSSVVLPAPLRPMIPSTSPRGTSKLTWSSAQIESRAGRGRRRARCTAFANSPETASRRLPCRTSRSPRRYRFARPRTSIAGSDNVGELPFLAPEVDDAHDEHDEAAEGRQRDVAVLGTNAAEQPPAPTLDDPGHGVQPEQRPPRLVEVERSRRVEDRAREHPELQQERDHEPDVAVLHVQRGEPRSDPDRGR